MKKFNTTAMAAALILSIGAGQAMATSAAADFDVNLTLTPTCIISDNSGTSLTALGSIDIDYTAFQTSPGTGFTSFFVRCSDGMTVTSIDLDSASITDGKTGLAYTLALKTANSGNAKTPVATLSNEVGSATGKKYFIQAYVPSGQAGITPAGTPNNKRTVTITY